ncbi:ribose ABC transporter ATP-binding protein [Rhizobiales bacterium GAS188]|nr:ribose ABC transporter ATP-binding protein [Rhizobiales bacterium GAS188]
MNATAHRLREDPSAETTAPVVSMRSVAKNFGPTRAVDHIDLDLLPAEVHAIVGENGAGKSTLMHVLAGFFPDYDGAITVGAEEVHLATPAQARQRGVFLVHQELSLLPELTVAENILLGREPPARLPGFISRRAIEVEAGRHLRACGIDIDPAIKVERLSIAARQLVEIVKGVSASPRVLILDEPTSSLTIRDIRELFRIIQRLVARGTAVVYISHKLDEVFAIANRATVLRDGKRVETALIAEWTEARLVRAMVGRDLSALFPRTFVPPGAHRLEVTDLARRGMFEGVSFAVRAGEVVGMYGIIGAGRTKVAEALYGLAPADAGAIRVDGKPARIRSPAQALAAGIAMSPEDRHLQGLVPMLSVGENLSLSSLRQMSSLGFVLRGAERDAVARFLKQLLVRAASPSQEVSSLSGGNQQKVVIARSLMPQPKVLILDEPTRGVDVVAKAEVHATIDRLAQQGLAVLLISSELPEILGMSDRILVMRDGTIVGEVARATASEEQLVAMAAGASHG